jgi:hypothetical protein
MVAGRVDAAALSPHPDCAPRSLQSAAAQLAVRRKAAAEAAARERAARGSGGLDAARVRKGPFLGQVVLAGDGSAARCGRPPRRCLG